MLTSLDWGLLFLTVPHTGHGRHGAIPWRGPRFGLREALGLLGEVSSDRRIVTMIVLGAVLLESVDLLRPSVPSALICPAAWGVSIGLFPAAGSYGVALTLLVLTGIFNIAFTSMAQTLVQVLAPPRLRGSIVGLFNTASLGLRGGSGLTVGVLGALVNVHWSLALSAAVVVATSVALLVREGRLAGARGAPTGARGAPRRPDAAAVAGETTMRAGSRVGCARRRGSWR
jgi:hypothetical protein